MNNFNDLCYSYSRFIGIHLILFLGVIAYSRPAMCEPNWNEPFGYQKLVKEIGKDPVRNLCKIVFLVSTHPALPHTSQSNGYMLTPEDRWAGNKLLDGSVDLLPPNFYQDLTDSLRADSRKRIKEPLPDLTTAFRNAPVHLSSGQWSNSNLPFNADHALFLAKHVATGYDSFSNGRMQKGSRTSAINLSRTLQVPIPESVLLNIVNKDRSPAARWAALLRLFEDGVPIETESLNYRALLSQSWESPPENGYFPFIPAQPFVKLGKLNVYIPPFFNIEGDVKFLLSLLQEASQQKLLTSEDRLFYGSSVQASIKAGTGNKGNWFMSSQFKVPEGTARFLVTPQQRRNHQMNFQKVRNHITLTALAAAIMHVESAAPLFCQYIEKVVELAKKEGRSDISVDYFIFAVAYALDPEEATRSLFDIFSKYDLKKSFQDLLSVQSEQLFYMNYHVNFLYKILSEEHFIQFVERFFPEGLSEDDDDEWGGGGGDDDPDLRPQPGPDGLQKPMPVEHIKLKMRRLQNTWLATF